MKLKVARFAPPGVNRATTGFVENMGPYGAHSGIHYISLNLWVNATLTWKAIASGDSFKKFPKQKQ